MALEIFDNIINSYFALMQKDHETLVFTVLVELNLNISSMITRSGDEAEKDGTENILDKLKKNFPKMFYRLGLGKPRRFPCCSARD